MNKQTIHFFAVVCAALLFVLIVLALGVDSTPAEETPIIEATPESSPPTEYRLVDHLTVVEFELDDGTPCVMVAAPSSRPVRLAGPSIPGQGGVSCNWNFTERNY